MLTFFANPLLCLKQDDFKITLRGGRKDSKYCIKVSLVYKIAFWFELLAITQDQPFFVIEFVRSAVLFQTNYFEQEGILRRL